MIRPYGPRKYPTFGRRLCAESREKQEGKSNLKMKGGEIKLMPEYTPLEGNCAGWPEYT